MLMYTTFGPNGQKLNSRPVYWSRLYGTEIQNLDKDQTMPAFSDVAGVNIFIGYLGNA